MFDSHRDLFHELTDIEVADNGYWGVRCRRGYLSPRRLAVKYMKNRYPCAGDPCDAKKVLQPLILEDDIKFLDSRAAVLNATWSHDTTQTRLVKTHPEPTHLGSYEAATDRHRFNEVFSGPTQLLLVRLEPGARVHPKILVEPTVGLHGHKIFSEWFRDADVIRYVNGHEAPGSVSLAVRPQALLV